MFFSNENAYMLPVPTLPLVEQAINHNDFLQHQHYVLLSDYFPPSENNLTPQTVTADSVMGLYDGVCTVSNNGVFQCQMSHQKQDRHTKIYTARGLRDWRVRLSMSIAPLSAGGNGSIDHLMSESYARFTAVENKECQRVSVNIVVAREMRAKARAKARARARERTKEKMTRNLLLASLDNDPFSYHLRLENHFKLCNGLNFHSESMPVNGAKQSGIPQADVFGANGFSICSNLSASNEINVPTAIHVNGKPWEMSNFEPLR